MYMARKGRTSYCMQHSFQGVCIQIGKCIITENVPGSMLVQTYIADR